ncbi:MAG: ATPase [Streptosporangiaceae bacterium]|nr:ATPase [Streptosporangiaceae bacterium]
MRGHPAGGRGDGSVMGAGRNYDVGVVWGPGYVGAPPQSPSTAQDPFTAAERDTHAIVSAAWWSSAPPQQRRHAIGGRVLVLPDGTWWLFGAWARWYRWQPSDGQWHLCPPPQALATRMSGRPAQAGQVPGLPPHVVPAGPDFAFDPPAPLPFVRHDLPPELTARIRAIVESAAALPVSEYPHRWPLFSSSVPSAVAVSWGVMLWCAAAPVFDSRLDDEMLGVWNSYRARPLPVVDGPRWLTPPPLEALVGLYAERLRSDRVDAAVVVLRTMWAIASALREDIRFRARADGLLTILGSTLNNPTVDYGALPYGDQAIVQQWIARCPPNLAPALRMDSSPGDHFRHSYYDLAQAIASVAGDPAEPAYIEPRLVAATLIAADLAVVRQDVVDKVVPWLDPEIRYSVQAVLSQSGHPLRRLWPDTAPPETLRGLGGDAQETLLAAMYGVDLAWCRLGGGIPARPRGFPVPTAIISEIIGVERATAVAPEPVAADPGGAPARPRRPPGSYPGEGPRSPAQEPGRPGPPGPAMGAEVPGLPAPGRPYVQLPPAQEPVNHPVRQPAWPGQGPVPVPAVAPPGGPANAWPPGGGHHPGQDWSPPDGSGPDDPPAETRVDDPLPRYPAPGPPQGAARSRPPRTRVMSESMVEDFEFLQDTPVPEQPVDQIAPPPGDAPRPVMVRFGVSFVSGDEDPAVLLDELRGIIGTREADEPEPASAPSVLLVGAPHTGQRRLARLIALTLADAGVGDGSVRTAAAEDVRGAGADRMTAMLQAGGPILLFEDFDAAILGAAQPAAMAEAARTTRRDTGSETTLIATCGRRAHDRLARDHPELMEGFRVFRMPGFTEPDSRLTLLHVLADERRVTVAAEAMKVAAEDLARLRGPGELVNARLVEAYLEQACQRHLTRAGGARDRLVLEPEDLTGLAEALEPALRPPGDVQDVLRRLDEMVGLEDVKRTVDGLVAEARVAAERAHHGLPAGDVRRNLIFLGPPGVGKTTVAGLLGGAYAALGLLDSGHLVACPSAHLTGRDPAGAETRVSAMVDQAMGGVLLIQQAHLLARSPGVVATLLRHIEERRDDFMIVCIGRPEEIDSFLAADPRLRARFATTLEFGELSGRELVRLFQRQADRDLYLLDEELRVELLARFDRMRGSEDFEYARAVRALYQQTVARQAARAGADVRAARVSRLSARDLPESALERMLGSLHRSEFG